MGDDKGCYSSIGVEGCCSGGSAEFLSILGEGFALVALFWLAGISDWRKGSDFWDWWEGSESNRNKERDWDKMRKQIFVFYFLKISFDFGGVALWFNVRILLLVMKVAKTEK